MTDDDEDKVGYGKPPKQHQFKKRQSGNPRGRPRKNPRSGNPTLREILEKAGEETVEIQGERMTLLELEVRALQRKAAKGDVAASKHLAKLRSDAGVGTAAASGTGVLLVPVTSLEDWEASTERQQAQYRTSEFDGTEA